MRTLTLAISGSGGAGAIFTGELVLQLVAGNGGYGMLKKTFSPHIRGGESAAILCLGSAPVSTIPARIDLLVALEAGVRFVAAYPITPASDLLEWLAPPTLCWRRNRLPTATLPPPGRCTWRPGCKRW